MYRKITKVFLFSIIILCVSTIVLFADSHISEDQQAAQLYIQALEELIAEDYEDGLRYLEEIQILYPDSEYSRRAFNLITQFGLKRDTSGLVSFYIGNLITGTYITTGIPIVFQLGPVATGAAGIAGIGGSLYTSWLLTNDKDLSQGTQLQTDSVQITALMSYIFLYNMLREIDVVNLSYEVNNRIFWLGSMATAIASRTGGYTFAHKTPIPAGRPASYLTGYIWTNIYLGLALQGLFHIDNPWISYPAHIIFPGLVGYTALQAWDKGGWSPARVGMLSVGGAGGMLIGGFVSALLSPLENVLPQETYIFNVMLFGGIGQAATVYFTRNFSPDPQWNRDISMDIYPTIQASSNGTIPGFEIRLGY